MRKSEIKRKRIKLARSAISNPLKIGKRRRSSIKLHKDYMVYIHRNFPEESNIIFFVGVTRYISRAFSSNGRNKAWIAHQHTFGLHVDIIARGLLKDPAYKLKEDIIQSLGRNNLTNK